MRPNKLTIQAFGPFSGTEEIDFDRLGTNPLFLINGPTGAGKSSILDAICFALYGQTTGKDREAAHMRCDHSGAKLLTEVTLDFSLGSQTYRIRRSPTQEKPKTRGEGTTPHQTEAQLWEIKPEGEYVLVPKKAQEATRIIEDITGLNVEQFRQVMVLPQGKFREFLMADSSQREDIFSKLFQTGIYKRLENALKEQASSIRKDVETLRHQIMGILQGADLNTESGVQEQLTELVPLLADATKHKESVNIELTTAEKALEAGGLLTKAFQALETSQQTLQELDAQKSEIESDKQRLTRAQVAQKIEHVQTNLNKASQAKELLSKDISTTGEALTQQQQAQKLAQVALAKAETELLPVDGLKEQAASLKKLIPKIDELATASTLKRQNQKNLTATDTAFSQCQSQLKLLVENIQTSEAKAKTIKTELDILAEKQRELDTLLLLGRQRAKLDELAIEHSELTQQHAVRIKSFDSAKAVTEIQEIQVKTLEFKWHSNQASLLAVELQQDSPCPVCGSNEHPSPANLRNNDTAKNEPDVSKDEIEQAKTKLTQLISAQSQTENQITQTSTKLQSVEKALIDQQNELGQHQHQTTDQLRADWKQLDGEVKQLLMLKEELGQLETSLHNLSEQRAKTDALLEQARTAQQQAQQKHLLSQQAESHINQELPEQYRTPGTLNNVITDIEQNIKNLVERHDKTTTALNQVNLGVTQAASKLEQQNQQLQTLTQEHEQAINNWQVDLSKSAFNDEADFQSALLPEPEQQNLQEQLQTYADKLSGCKATLVQQKKQLADQQQPNTEQLQANRDQLNEASSQAINGWQQLDSRHQQLKDVQKKLNQAHKSNEALEAEYKVYGTLSEVANGQTGNKISLQRFVLSVLLDDVLIEASHRLHLMSKGRYLLVRKEDRAKGNKASGLELEVEDAYTGKTRSVATLSGGESFMAALSLALGLSDVVQAYAGGIKLDTLFIDEGFGSLDQESLDLAVKTLIDLQSSGRMVGIISHVSELKEQMALRIDVQSSATGSKVAIFAA